MRQIGRAVPIIEYIFIIIAVLNKLEIAFLDR